MLLILTVFYLFTRDHGKKISHFEIYIYVNKGFVNKKKKKKNTGTRSNWKKKVILSSNIVKKDYLTADRIGRSNKNFTYNQAAASLFALSIYLSLSLVVVGILIASAVVIVGILICQGID